MKKCADDCYPACDFCRHYAFNGREHEDLVYYTGDGWCKLHDKHMDPGQYCEDFHCLSLSLTEAVGVRVA